MSTSKRDSKPRDATGRTVRRASTPSPAEAFRRGFVTGMLWTFSVVVLGAMSWLVIHAALNRSGY